MSHLPTAEAFFAALAACAVKATLILALAWAASALARRGSAATRHQIWAMAIGCLLLLPFLQMSVPAWHAGAAGRVADPWGIGGPRTSSAAPARLAPVTINAAQPSLLPHHPMEWLSLIWALGLIAVLTRLAIGLGRLLRVSASARPLLDESLLRTVADCSRELGLVRSVRLLCAQDPRAMPSTWGLAHTRILLPAGFAEWPPDRRRIVLAHELAHIRRFDWPVRIAAECARALYWFHPLAWLAIRNLRDQGELACDDAVLASGVPADHYAGQLLELVRTARTAVFHSAATLAVARPSNLERRFTAMLDSSLNRRGLTRNAALLTTASALLLVLPLAALRAPAQDAAGRFSGAVFDPSGRPVTNATVIMTNGNGRTKDMTVTNAAGLFQFGALPAGTYELKVLKEGFALFATGIALDSGRDVTQNATLNLGVLKEEMDVTEPASQNTPKIRVGARVQQAGLVTQVRPTYPASAKAAGIQGSVLLKAVISKEGVPLSLRVQNATIDPDLAKAAVEAVSQWRYQPALLNGEPVEVITEITINFTLAR